MTPSSANTGGERVSSAEPEHTAALGARAGDGSAAVTYADRILALQRTAGNAAVGRFLSAEGTRRPPARRTLLRAPPTTAAPTATVTTTVERGALSPDIKRTSTEVLKEDLLVVKAKVKGLKTPSDSVVALALSPGMTIESGGWEGTTYVWKIRASSIGTFPLVISMVGGVNEAETTMVTVRSDAADQLRAIVEAQAILTRRFAEADKRLAEGGKQFAAAFKRHDTELKNVEAGEKLDTEMMWGVVFAALGGFAGGMAGALAKRSLDVFGGKDFSKTIPGEGFTDLGKDTVKYAVRSLSKSAPSVTGDSTAPGTGTLPSLPKSERKPVKPEPLTFYLDLKAALEAEKIEAFSHLEVVIATLRTLAARSSTVLFDEDPAVWAKKADVLIDTIAKQLETSELKFYEALWAAWFKAYYLPIIDFEAMQRSGRRYQLGFRPRSNSLRLTELLQQVVKTCGYASVQEFAEKYGDREAKQKEVDRLNTKFWEDWKKERGW